MIGSIKATMKSWDYMDWVIFSMLLTLLMFLAGTLVGAGVQVRGWHHVDGPEYRTNKFCVEVDGFDNDRHHHANH